MKLVKIFGLERSGTNYIQGLLEKNLYPVTVLTNQLGWKHGAPLALLEKAIHEGLNSLSQSEKKLLFRHKWFRTIENRVVTEESFTSHGLCFVIITKNPYSWYLSITRYKNVPAFPVKCEFIDQWNKMNAKWIEFAERNKGVTKIIQYERLVENPSAVVQLIGGCLQFDVKGCFYDIPYTIRPGYKFTSQEFNKEYYIEEKYLERFSRSDYSLISNAIALEITEKLGYEVAPVNGAG